MARVTAGYKDNGQAIQKPLGYFERREDALIFLAQYNANPYDIVCRNMSFSEVYSKFEELQMPSLSRSLQNTLRSAYKLCEPLYKVKYRDMKTFQMQDMINSCGLSYATQIHIRNLFCHLDKLAFELDIIDKRRSETLTVATAEPKEKHPFTKAEISTLWKHQGEPCINETLFMLYTGFRVTEMLTVLRSKIDLQERIIIGGIKTEAGKNRPVPIHDKLLPIIETQLALPGDVLFPVLKTSRNAKDERAATKSFFLRQFGDVMDSLGMEHTTHDCRHTFRSALDSAGANKVCIDIIMGHKSRDVGERVYTHKTPQELREAVALLSYE